MTDQKGMVVTGLDKYEQNGIVCKMEFDTIVRVSNKNILSVPMYFN